MAEKNFGDNNYMALAIVQWKLCVESVIMVSYTESMRHSIAEFLKSFKDQTRPISLSGGLPYWWLEAVMKKYPFRAISPQLLVKWTTLSSLTGCLSWIVRMIEFLHHTIETDLGIDVTLHWSILNK